MPPPPARLRYAILRAGHPAPVAYVDGTDEADAIQHYCTLYPLALAYRDTLRATRTKKG